MSPLFPLVLLAAAPAPQPVTFAAARQLAEQRCPDLTLAQRRAAVSQADVAVAGALANPTLTVTSATQTARLGTGISVPLPVFGQVGTAVDAARADARVALLDVEVARHEARRTATLAWVDLWEAQRRAQLLATAAADAQRVFDVAREKAEAGTGAKVDMLRTRADHARAAAEAEAATHQVSAASSRLAAVLGLAAPLGAAGEPDYSEVPAAVALELTAHPALLRDREAVSAAQGHLTAERRQVWPVLNAQFGVNLFDPSFTGPEFVFGLSFDLPVLSLRGGAIDRASAQRLLAETALSVEEQRLRTEAGDARERALAAAAQRQALKTQVLPDLEESRALTEEGYRVGRLELLRVLETQKALLESRLAEAQAVAAWTRAVADLERSSNLRLTRGPTDAP